MIGLWEGIPLGFVLRLPPVAIGLASALGSTTATLIVLVLGEGLRERLLRRRVAAGAGGAGGAGGPAGAAGGVEKRERLIDRVWRSHGLVGFALLAPILIGAPLGVATGLFVGAPARRLLPWLLVGIALWTVVLTVAGAFGSAGIRALITG